MPGEESDLPAGGISPGGLIPQSASPRDAEPAGRLPEALMGAARPPGGWSRQATVPGREARHSAVVISG